MQNIISCVYTREVVLCKFKKGVVKLLRKHFVLSAGTVVAKRNVTQSFGNDNTVIIPMATLDKIQSKYLVKRDERARIARDFLALIGSYSFKQLREGIIQPNGSCLRVVTDYAKELSKKVGVTQLTSTEVRMLQTCLGLQDEVSSEEPVILVSKSPLLRMKAEMTGVKAQEFKDELLPELHEQYTGRKEVHVTDELVSEFYKNKKIPIEALNEHDKEGIYHNMFIHLKGANDNAIGRVQRQEIVKLTFEKSHPYGVTPKNLGQKFAIEALMMDAPLVIIKGPAGTAKTFLSLATGLEQVEVQGKYPNRILVTRSPTETGEKIGFLPGTEAEKIDPYMRGIKDNLRNLLKRERGVDEFCGEKPQYEDGTSFFERGLIQAEALGYIRGRTIVDTLIIVDEAQNLTPVEVKTILTRVGMGTKLILLGDPEQIDRPGLDERTNGLSYASERFKGQDICWQITLKDSESVRSELARKAAMLL